MDGDVAKQFQRILEKQGMEFNLGAKVTGVKKSGKGAKVTFEPVKGGDAETTLPMSCWSPPAASPTRRASGLKRPASCSTSAAGCRSTSIGRPIVPGIYAIGDVVAGPMLAHKAEDEGMALAEIIAGQHGHVNYDVIPGVVYTQPEVASVGKTEEELKAAGIEVQDRQVPVLGQWPGARDAGDGRFRQGAGRQETDRVLGVHIVGKGAGEMIHEAAVLMEFGGSSEDLGRTCHAHPTMSEAVREAALWRCAICWSGRLG
jgi:dihydrolipoamide dehydrogenase